MTPPTLEELKEFRRGLGICYKALGAWIDRLDREPLELNDDISDVGRQPPHEWAERALVHPFKSRLVKKDIEFLQDCADAGESYDLTERRIAWFRDIARKLKQELPAGCE
jgi:hypothetical protein